MCALLESGFGDESTGGGLFAVDGTEVERLDWLSTTGLAYTGEKVLRMLRAPGATTTSTDLLVYDERGVERYYRLDEVRDPHGVTWDGEHFVVASTGTNEVVFISPEGRAVRSFKAPGLGDCWHLNSLCVHGGTVFCAAFGRFAAHRGWDDPALRAGAGLVLDLDTRRPVLTGLTGPHNPVLVDGRWLLCNSYDQELVSIDPASGGVMRVASLDGFARGLAVSDGAMHVGVSARRHESGERTTASVVHLDRETWRELGRAELPVAEVYDVIEVDSEFLGSVRRGFRTNAFRDQEERQYELFRAAGVAPVRLWASGDPLPEGAFRARVTSEEPGPQAPGTTVRLRCTVENLAPAILTSAPPNPVRLSYRIFAHSGDTLVQEGPRVMLPRSLPPGELVELEIDVQSPVLPGRYLLRVSLVQELVAWFDDIAAENGSVSTLVVEPGPVDAPASSGLLSTSDQPAPARPVR